MKQLNLPGLPYHADAVLSKRLHSPAGPRFDAVPGRNNPVAVLFTLCHARS